MKVFQMFLFRYVHIKIFQCISDKLGLNKTKTEHSKCKGDNFPSRCLAPKQIRVFLVAESHAFTQVYLVIWLCHFADIEPLCENKDGILKAHLQELVSGFQ